MRGSAAGTGGLVGLVVGALLTCLMFAGLLVAGASDARAGEPEGASAAPAVGHVVVVAVPGLGWERTSQSVTPGLAGQVAAGGAATVTVRSARSITCPADGYLTLGAGNRARGGSQRDGCPRTYPFVLPVPDASGGAQVPEMAGLVRDNAGELHGAVPGALATAVSCVTAVGPFATLAAADPQGRVASYAPSLPGQDSELAALLARCPVTVVGADELVPDPAGVNDALASIDRTVARVRDAGPAGSALIVVGVSSVERERARLLYLSATGPTYSAASWLRTASTNRDPYVQLIDVAPTALGLLGVTSPESMSGQSMTSVGHRDPAVRPVAGDLVDADLMARTVYRLVNSWWGALTALVVGFCAAAAGLTRWAATLADSGAHDSARRVRRALEIVALSVAAVPVATFLTHLLPWWRQLIPAGFYSTWVTIWVGLLVAVGLGIPWGRTRYRILAPAGVVTAVTAVVLGVDVLTGSDLEFGSINGYNAIVAGRFVGFGNTGFAAYAAGLLLALVMWTQGVRRRVALPVMLVLGGIGTVLVANPAWGNDFGGTITLFAAVGVLVLFASGIRLNIWWLLAVGVGAGLSALLVAWLDYQRPPEERTHFGRFMEDLLSGEAWTVVHRKLANNIDLMLSSPLTFTIPAAAALAWLVLRRSPSGLPQALAASTYLRAGVWGVLTCGVVGSLVNDSGVAVAALTIAVAVPSLVAVGMRWLAEPAPRENDRSGSGPAPGDTPAPGHTPSAAADASHLAVPR